LMIFPFLFDVDAMQKKRKTMGRNVLQKEEGGVGMRYEQNGCFLMI